VILLSLCGNGAVSDLARSVADPFGFWAVAVLGVVSGVDYVVSWSRRAMGESRARA
jgi:hypothetical protein